MAGSGAFSLGGLPEDAIRVFCWWLTALDPHTWQLLRSYASDLYNPQVAAVLGIILDITTTDCQSMAEAQSRESEKRFPPRSSDR